MGLGLDVRRAVKLGIIRGGLEATALVGALGLAPTVGGRGMIFTLHHVRPAMSQPFSPNGHLSITPAFLEVAILAAKKAGLTPVHLDDLPALLADEADKRKFVCFTLDDGYRDNAEHAAPVFRRHGIPFTVFATAGFVERTRSLWWETLEALLARTNAIEFDFGNGPTNIPTATTAEKQAAFDRIADHLVSGDEDSVIARIDEAAERAGIDPLALVRDLVMDAAELRALAADPLAQIGAHTLTHPILSHVSPDRLARELSESADAVERYVGRRPLTLAYPYGSRQAIGQREIEAASSARFHAAVLTEPGVLTADAAKIPTALPRVSLNGHFQSRRYVRALISGMPFLLLNRRQRAERLVPPVKLPGGVGRAEPRPLP